MPRRCPPVNARPAVYAATALALLLAAVAVPGAAGAAEVLRAHDVELGAGTEHFALTRWQGRPAVSALTLNRHAQGGSPWVVHTVVLDADGWREVNRWPLPADTRWVEPLQLPEDLNGWLLLVGQQWKLATPAGEALRLRPLCPCNTVYSHGGTPDPERHRFGQDLDGDGIDEIVLPYSAHLEAYRITPRFGAPEPLWRVRWHADATPLPRAEGAGQGFVVPAFRFRDVDGDGRPDLLVEERTAVRIAALPPPQGAPAYGMDAARRALLQRRAEADGLPPTLLEALRRLGDRRYDTAAAFLAALAQPATPEQQATWAPHLLQVLTLARNAVPVHRPYTVPLQGLGTFGEEDVARLLGRTDMDGDGVLDVLHAKLLDFGSALSQENELRWYRGRMEGGRLTFAPPAETLKSDAGSFAELARPRTDDAAPLALLMATTEVSLGSIMKALASQSVTLEARVFLWEPGGLIPQPVAAAEFTYWELRADGRRAMFLFADLDGDGWRDYLLNLRQGELTWFQSAGGPPALDKPAGVQTGLPLPSRPERVLIADLDDDGREELVLRFNEKHHGALGHKLRLLRLEPE